MKGLENGSDFKSNGIRRKGDLASQISNDREHCNLEC